MAATAVTATETEVDLLNEDLSREYQAIIAYVNYSQVLKGAGDTPNIAAELEVHAGEELRPMRLCQADRLSRRLKPTNKLLKLPKPNRDFGQSQGHA